MITSFLFICFTSLTLLNIFANIFHVLDHCRELEHKYLQPEKSRYYNKVNQTLSAIDSSKIRLMSAEVASPQKDRTASKVPL